jgi:hypothetical protein
MGTGAAIAGVTALGSAVRGATTVAQTASTLSRLERIGRTISATRKILPANLPSTLIEKTLGKQLGTKAYAGTWLATQALEGAVEEGFTEVLNQSLNKYVFGTKLSYDGGMIYTAAWQGALMEPVLGGGLAVATIPISATISYASAGGIRATEALFEVPKNRFKELSTYFDLITKVDLSNLTEGERQVRIGQLARFLVLERSLNDASNNQFGKIEDNQELFSILRGVTSNVTVDNADPNNFGLLTSLGLTMPDIVYKLNNQYTYDIERNALVPNEPRTIMRENLEGEMENIGDTSGLPTIYLSGNPFISVDKDNKIVLSKDGLELALLSQAYLLASRSNDQPNRISNFVSAYVDYKFTQDFKKNNPDASEQQIEEALLKYKTEGVTVNGIVKTYQEAGNSVLQGLDQIYGIVDQIEDAKPVEIDSDIPTEDIDFIRGLTSGSSTAVAPTAEPTIESTVEPTTEPIAKPTAEPITEPAAEAIATPKPEAAITTPVVETITETPKVAPVTKPVESESKVTIESLDSLPPELQALIKNVDCK